MLDLRSAHNRIKIAGTIAGVLVPLIDECVNVQDPVCTPDGYLFSKEAIIENLVQQKKAIKRKMAAWEAQQSDDQLKVNA